MSEPRVIEFPQAPPDPALRAALLALPMQAPEPALWVTTAARIQRRLRWRAWSRYGAAACLTLCALLGGIVVQQQLEVSRDVAQLKRASAQLERAYALLPLDRGVMSVNDSLAEIELEEQLAAVDHTLSGAALSPRQTRLLWRQRVALMSDLVALHVDRLERGGPASGYPSRPLL